MAVKKGVQVVRIDEGDRLQFLRPTYHDGVCLSASNSRKCVVLEKYTFSALVAFPTALRNEEGAVDPSLTTYHKEHKYCRVIPLHVLRSNCKRVE